MGDLDWFLAPSIGPSPTSVVVGRHLGSESVNGGSSYPERWLTDKWLNVWQRYISFSLPVKLITKKLTSERPLSLNQAFLHLVLFSLQAHVEKCIAWIKESQRPQLGCLDPAPSLGHCALDYSSLSQADWGSKRMSEMVCKDQWVLSTSKQLFSCNQWRSL